MDKFVEGVCPFCDGPVYLEQAFPESDLEEEKEIEMFFCDDCWQWFNEDQVF